MGQMIDEKGLDRVQTVIFEKNSPIYLMKIKKFGDILS